MAANNEYEKLIEYFKTLVKWSLGVISIFVIAIGVFFFRDYSDMRDRLKQMEDNANKSILRVEQDAKFKIDSIKSNIGKTVDNTVNAELDKIFRTQKIEELIETKIINKVEGELKEITNQEIEEFNRRIKPDIMISDEASYYYHQVKETADEQAFNQLLNMYETNTNKRQKQIIQEKLEMLFSVYQVQNYSLEKLKEVVPSLNSIPDDINKADDLIKMRMTDYFHPQTIAIYTRVYNLLHNTNYKPYQYREIIDLIKTR